MIIQDPDWKDKKIVKCELCMARTDILAATPAGWDWFTGTLPRTFYYCHQHSHSRERDAAFSKSRVNPHMRSNAI